MANSYFQFKQFTIYQDRCAMKVSTDACLQGAWTPIADSVRNVLDIGAGTGLLSLMLAQRNDAIQVDAIELDPSAAAQAEENVNTSPWSNRVSVTCADVRTYHFSQQYDLVICNPPFFSNSLLGDADRRNHARHTIALSHSELLSVLQRVLRPNGYASILLPVVEHQTWTELLNEGGWHISHRLYIHHRDDTSPNRVISLCSRESPESTLEERLTIFATEHHYSTAATALLRPFYLKL